MTIISLVLLLLVATFVSQIFSYVDASASSPEPAATLTASSSSSSVKTEACNSLICQVEEANFKLSKLESSLEKSIQDLNAKSSYVKECEKKIEELSRDIDLLKSTLASFQDDSSRTNEKLSALEEELQLLWSVSRRNNFEIHTLEYRLHDADKKLEVHTSQVEQMADIVSEQWIQIQQLEQAVQMSQVRTLKVTRHISSRKCPFVKFMKNLLGEHLETLKGILDPCVVNGRSVLEKAMQYLKRTFSAAKSYHHQLQGYIKQSMVRNEFTAILASEEVVFFYGVSSGHVSNIMHLHVIFVSHQLK